MKMETAKYDENRLLHLLLDMGEMLLASGAEINRVEDTLQRIGRAYGAAKMNVFVITSSIVITMERTDGELLTHTRRVNYTGSTDFTALEQLNALSRNCCINPIPLDQFQRRLQEIAEPRGRWDLYMGSILAAGSFAVFFGGTFADGVVAALVAVLICFIQQKATKFFANTIMFNLFCSFVVGTVICLTVKVLPVLNMDKIMIGDIMLLIPGIPATNSIRDMLMGDTISGLMRLIESILWAGALACGFMWAIWFVGGDFAAYYGFCRFSGICHAVPAETVIVGIGISGRCYLLGRISSGNVFQRRTDLYFRTGGFGTVSSLCGFSCSQKESSGPAVFDSVSCAADSGKYAVLHDECSSAGKYRRSVTLWQSDTSVCIVHRGWDLYRVDDLINFPKILCSQNKQN